MLYITFVASRVPVSFFDQMRKVGEPIIPANMVGSVLKNDGKALEIGVTVYTTDEHWEKKVETYEELVSSYDPGYHK